MRTAGVGVLAALLIAAVPSGVPEAAPAAKTTAPEAHCWWQVENEGDSDELVVVAETCFPSLTAVDEAIGAARSAAKEGGFVTMAQFTIGRHFTGLSFTGSSITVTGADCLGGYVNMSTSWNNVISSTLHGCGKIRHYDGFNMVGVSQYTYYPGGNLTTMDNRTSSIQYLN